MSGDQVLRVLVVKQMNDFSYAALHFHLMDSASYRTFCRFGALEAVPSRSALAENLKKVRAETLEEVTVAGQGGSRKEVLESAAPPLRTRCYAGHFP